MNITRPRTRTALVFIAAILILWFRAPLRVEHGFLWAEDAPIFLLQAHTLGSRAIFTPYAGYLHLIPRLVAALQVSLTSVRGAPYFYMWSALLLTAGACAYIASALRTLPPLAAVAIGLSIVLSPQNGEMILTITNLQWVFCPLLFVLLWECIFDPPTHGIAWRCALTAALAMTGPFGLLLCFVAVLAMALASRKRSMSRKQIVWLASYAAGVVAQAMTLMANPQPRGVLGSIDWATRLLKDVFCGLIPGAVGGVPIPLWAGVVLAALFVASWIASRSIVVAFLPAFGIGVWAASVLRIDNPDVLFTWYGDGSRYLYLPLICFMWAGIISGAVAPTRPARWLGTALACTVLLCSATKFAAITWPDWTMEKVPGDWKIVVPPGWTIDIPLVD